MGYIYATGFVTMRDIETYFKGEDWPISESTGDDFHAEAVWNFQIDLKRKDSNFQVKIKSPEDPTDSHETVTPDPVQTINDFLSEGISDSEWLRAASTPNVFSNILRRLARSIDNSNNPSLFKVSKLLRRISLISASDAHVARKTNTEIEPLMKQMEKEGWKVHKQGDGAETLLKVDVGEGTYNAEISPENIIWEYRIQFKGNDDLTVEGTTDDPIAEYMKWKKNPKVGEAWREFKKNREESKTQDNSNQTMPATPRKKAQPVTETMPATPKGKRD